MNQPLKYFSKDVIDLSKKYLPEMAKGFASPKVTVIISDGCEYLKQHVNEFDVIITDSSDPDGKSATIEMVLLVLSLKYIFRSS